MGEMNPVIGFRLLTTFCKFYFFLSCMRDFGIITYLLCYCPGLDWVLNYRIAACFIDGIIIAVMATDCLKILQNDDEEITIKSWQWETEVKSLNGASLIELFYHTEFGLVFILMFANFTL